MGQGRIEGSADVTPPTRELIGFGMGNLVLVGSGSLVGTAEVTLETIELTGFGAGFAEDVVGTATGAFVFEPTAAGALLVAVDFGVPA
jgi:hypothetical protein